MTHAPIPPLADPSALVDEMAKAHRRLVADLLERSGDGRALPSIQAEYEEDRLRGRTGEAFEDYRRGYCDQVGASWVLCAVFARTLEDRGYVPHRVAGPGAADRFAQFRAMFRFLGARDYLLHLFDAMALLPGGQAVFGRDRAPLWKLSPSAGAANELLEALRAADGGGLRFTFGRPEGAEHDGASTRYLGDLYQNLNEDVRKRYALLQTPEFVERFLLDHTLGPALRERGVAVTVLDPACGSGHLLLGAYDRLFEARRAREPGVPAAESARAALGQVLGIDLNPYATAVARFRLLLAYLDKAGISTLDGVPEDLPIQVYVGDSLLAGREYQATFGDELQKKGLRADGTGYEASRVRTFYDPETDELLTRTRFDVVVANPPYITEKDEGKRAEIRQRYRSAAGAFSLSAPFAERIFQLASHGGYTGQITANSFMKREFGKKLVEEVLPRWDLTEVIDTSGAFIPGHGTPTVILFGRAQQPVTRQVRVVMGSRGEPAVPEDPAKGKVWGAIAAHHLEEGYSDDLITVAGVERSKLAKHPWSIGGGGAAELKEILESSAAKRLGDVVSESGFGAVTREDELFQLGGGPLRRAGIGEAQIRPLVAGEDVRDWAISGQATLALWPYDPETLAVVSGEPAAAVRRLLWPFRRQLAERVAYGMSQIERGLQWFEYSMFFGKRFRTPLTIAYAEVATHNHFALDRGGKAFKQTAPILKLPETATEEDHLALLAYLDSSTACFWMKQVSYPKATSVGDVAIEKGRPENNRYAFASTALSNMPLPPLSSGRWAAQLASLAEERAALSVTTALDEPAGPPDPAAAIERLEQRHDHLTRRLVALQEELDWAVYEAFGLCKPGEAGALESPDEPIRPEQRPFAWENGPPADLPPSALPRYQVRRRIIETSPLIRQIETPVYKRLWRGQQGVFGQNTLTFRERQIEALRDWLLGRVEATFRDKAARRPQSVRAIAHTLHSDLKIRAVAEVLAETSTFDLEALLADLVQREAVPSATCQRYTDLGIAKRREWEKTWQLQRREDAGETVKIAVPPKYDQKDFENPAVLWRLRGKLDVPRERFIAYPTATPPPGTSGKAAFTIGWAGWNALEQLEAAIVLWQEEMGAAGHLLLSRAERAERAESLGPAAAADERRKQDAAAREKLMPLLQTMADLLPWVAQWHDADGQTAREYTDYLTEQARLLEVSLDEARAHRRPKAARARRSPKRAV